MILLLFSKQKSQKEAKYSWRKHDDSDEGRRDVLAGRLLIGTTVEVDRKSKFAWSFTRVSCMDTNEATPVKDQKTVDFKEDFAPPLGRPWR
jgi:hypothetical protein